MDPLINILESGLDGSYRRQQLLSNNIANINTPNYKRKDIDFINVLKNQYQNNSQTATGRVALSKTNNKHLSKDKVTESSFKAQTNFNNTYKNDNNNVDIDVEMAELAKNNIYYDTLVKQVNTKFSMLKKVISDGGK